MKLYDSPVAAAVRPERDDCGDDLGGDARKFGYEYGGEARAVGAFVAGVAAGSGDRVEVRITCPIDSVPRWNSGPGTKQRGEDPGTSPWQLFETALET